MDLSYFEPAMLALVFNALSLRIIYSMAEVLHLEGAPSDDFRYSKASVASCLS